MRSCAGEMEREVNAILSPLGVDDALSRRIAGALLSVEATLPPPEAPLSITRQCLNAIARRPRFTNLTNSDPERARLLPTKTDKDADDDDKGLTAFLLKFGEGLEETTDARLFISALTIGLSYFLGGLIPLAPYFFFHLAIKALWWSVGITGVVLLLFGAVKAYVSGAEIGVSGASLPHLSLPLRADRGTVRRLCIRQYLDPPRRWCCSSCLVRHRPRTRRSRRMTPLSSFASACSPIRIVISPVSR